MDQSLLKKGGIISSVTVCSSLNVSSTLGTTLTPTINVEIKTKKKVISSDPNILTYEIF